MLESVVSLMIHVKGNPSKLDAIVAKTFGPLTEGLLKCTEKLSIIPQISWHM